MQFVSLCVDLGSFFFCLRLDVVVVVAKSLLACLQSAGHKRQGSRHCFLGTETTYNMTEVIILVISLVIFYNGSLQLMLLANKLIFTVYPLKNNRCNVSITV